MGAALAELAKVVAELRDGNATHGALRLSATVHVMSEGRPSDFPVARRARMSKALPWRRLTGLASWGGLSWLLAAMAHCPLGGYGAACGAALRPGRSIRLRLRFVYNM